MTTPNAVTFRSIQLQLCTYIYTGLLIHSLKVKLSSKGYVVVKVGLSANIRSRLSHEAHILRKDTRKTSIVITNKLRSTKWD